MKGGSEPPKSGCSAWAWWDAERKQFRHVYPSRLCVEICFPYGGESKIRQGLGQIVQVTITPDSVAGNLEKERLRNMLEDVVNELDLSEGMFEKHGPLGTPPAELVRLVLQRKDQEIAMVRAGMRGIYPAGVSGQPRSARAKQEV